MCGRLASALQPQDMCKACCYKPTKGGDDYSTPQWKHINNSGKIYQPSYNICPTEVALVLTSGNHFMENSRLLLPMVFGVIPEWSDGKVAKWNTVNCRIETIEKSKLYGPLLKKGFRCAVVCTGFYEWQKKTSTERKPYFIHGEQPDGVVVDDPKTWNLKFTSDKGFFGFKPLKLAGLFNIKTTGTLNEATLSFTIITKKASSKMSWLHQREPVILETDEQLDGWLNNEVDFASALSYLNHQINFIFFPVSGLVNKSVNKDISCIKYEKHSENISGNVKSSQAFLQTWLERGQKRKTDNSLGIVDERVKKEIKTKN